MILKIQKIIITNVFISNKMFDIVDMRPKDMLEISLFYIAQFELSQYNTENKWDEIVDMLKGDDIDKIEFKDVIVWNQTLHRILNMPNLLQSVKSLYFSSIVFNQALVQTFWRQPILQKLQSLDMNDCSIEDRDLRFIDQSKTYKIQNLSLKYNYISAQGMRYMSNLKLPNLTSLDIYDVSLATNQSVDYLLKLNLSRFTEIDIGRTSLSDYNAYRIISQLDPTRLQTLNISANQFGLQFYRNLTHIKFTNLKSLNLNFLYLNQDIVPFLQNWSFPQLATLSIGGNWLFVDASYKFLNHQNYPKLKQISIFMTSFQVGFFQHFVTQFKDHKFYKLSFDGHGIQPKAFQHLLILDTSQLKTLHIKKGLAHPDLIMKLIQKQMNNLEYLNLQQTTNTGNLFQAMFLNKWDKLKQLQIFRAGFVNINKIKQVTHQAFPVLQVLRMDFRHFQVNQFRQLMFELSKHSQNMIQVVATMSTYYNFILDIAQNSYKNIPKKLKISIKSHTQSFLNQNQILKFKAILQPQSKPIIKQFKFVSTLEELQLFKLFTNQQLVKIFLDNCNFTQIQKFSDDVNGTLIKHISKQLQNKNNKCVICSVTQLVFYSMKNISLDVLNNCQYPHLKTAHFGSDSDNFTSKQTGFMFIKANLSQIKLIQLNFPKIERQNFTKFLKDQQFDSLQSITFVEIRMRSQDFYQIIKNNSNMRRIRQMNLYSTNIEKDLNFLVDFNMSFRTLQLAYTLIGPIIHQLSPINYQFLRILTFQATAISNQQFITFLSSIPLKSWAVFPKLAILQLSNNYIQNSGTVKLFEVGTPNLVTFQMNMNKDYNIINTVFNSLNSKRILQIAFFKNQQDSIDHNINKKYVRHIKKLIVQSSNLRAIDIQALSGMDFRSLRQVIFDFSQKFQCQIFNHLIKIVYNCKKIIIILQKGTENLNSRCFNNNISNYNFKFVSRFQISSSDKIHSDLRSYTDRFLDTAKSVEYLSLIGAYPSEQSLSKFLRQVNLDYLNTFNMQYNDLNDDAVKYLFAHELKVLEYISIVGNPRVTSQAIKLMKGKTYSKLRVLDFGFTSIDDQGIQILASCQLPQLSMLELQNTQITNKSISLLSKLKAPILKKIDLSSNELTYKDIKQLNVSNFKHLQTIFFFPYLLVKEVQELKKLFNEGRSSSNTIKIQTNLIQLQAKLDESQDQFFNEDL